MNRNNGREIAERLHLLRDYFIKHADRTHAVSMADLQRHLSNKGFIGGNGVALDKKTIYRDLDTLKMLFDMDIEYVEKVYLDESQLAELNRRLLVLHDLTRTARLAKQNRVTVTAAYYVPCTDKHSFACGVRGQYMTVTGLARKVDGDLTRTLLVDETAISFDDLLSVEAEDEALFRQSTDEDCRG